MEGVTVEMSYIINTGHRKKINKYRRYIRVQR